MFHDLLAFVPDAETWLDLRAREEEERCIFFQAKNAVKSRNAFLFLLFYCYLGKTLFFTSSILTVDLQSFLHLNIVWAKCKESVPDGDLCLTSSVKLSLVLDAFHYLNFCILLPLQYFNLQKQWASIFKVSLFCLHVRDKWIFCILTFLSLLSSLAGCSGLKVN